MTISGVDRELARQALERVTVTKFHGSEASPWWDLVDHLAGVIAKVRAEEREACAELVDSFGMSEHIVDAIRARGQA